MNNIILGIRKPETKKKTYICCSNQNSFFLYFPFSNFLGAFTIHLVHFKFNLLKYSLIYQFFNQIPQLIT